MREHIEQAANTAVPAILALESLGFAVELRGERLVASRGVETYGADDPAALLGLIRLVELRSWDWGASDQEIEDTLRRYDLR